MPRYRFERLTPQQRQDALRSATRFLSPDADEFVLWDGLYSCLRWDPEVCLESATKLLGNREPPKVQILAGLIVAEQGDRDPGLDAVASALARGTYSTLSSSDALRGVESLLSEGSESRYREAAVVFDRDYVNQTPGTEIGQILKRFADAYRPDAYRWLLAKLQDSTGQGSSSNGPLQRRDWAAQLAVEWVIPREAGLEYDFEVPPAIREENRKKIRAWLEARLAEMTGKH